MRNVPLPQGVKAVWDLSKAHHETTPTRERICINGLWRGQPVDEVGRPVPADNWGYYKVPAPWSANSQTLYPHPAWKGKNLRQPDVAWYQREISIPDAWQGRRIAVYAEYLNSCAAVYLDGKKVGDMYFPSGEVDITSACRGSSARPSGTRSSSATGRFSSTTRVGPADVMNRDPKEIELVSGGATVVGDGVLAVGQDANVVFCQLAPGECDYQKYYNQKRTFRRLSCLVARVLGNMGVDEPTPMLRRFSSPVRAAASESRWLAGFYLDKPEEFDDPYRYFQW